MSCADITNVVIDGLHVETLTLNELTAMFRRVGIATSETKLGDGIEQGQYPFGICIKSSKGSRQFEIYARLVYQWLEERATVNKSRKAG